MATTAVMPMTGDVDLLRHRALRSRDDLADARVFADRIEVYITATEITQQAVDEVAGLGRLALHQQQFRLTLWCEHPGHWHPTMDGVYQIERPAEWLQQVSRYASPILTLLSRALPLAGGVADITMNGAGLEKVKKELELMKTLLAEMKLPAPTDGPVPTGAPDAAPATGPDLRSIRRFLHDIDPYQRFGGMHRVQATSATTR
jgi:hypothetical protein